MTDEIDGLPNAGCCPHWTGRHDPDYGSCDHCACVNPALIEVDESSEHGPVPTTWFVRGMWPTCKCGLAPRDNDVLNAHWREHGFTVVDEHGHLVSRPIA